MKPTAIFLDDGGVISDNRRRGPRWRQLVAEFFPPLLGGDPAAWAEANGVVAARLLAPDAWLVRQRAASDYAAFESSYHRDWIGGMCQLVGVAPPPEAEIVVLGRHATAWITRRIDAAFPGAVAAIRALQQSGYPLYTASATSSTELAGYLAAAGVGDAFCCLYGPDLVDTTKSGPDYYTRIFADAGVDPGEALVVDDSPLALDWAAEAGARVGLVTDDAAIARHTHPRIAALSDLPAFLGAEQRD